MSRTTPAPEPHADDRPRHKTVLSRVGKNLRWLVGSTGFSGVTSLVYIAIAARSLGPAGFGVFALILTYGQLIANLVQFQSWKAVIRFGALHGEDRDKLARLFGYTATLDAVSAVGGALVALVCVPLVGQLLHWSGAEQQGAALFGAALLLTTGATPVGILRLFDRFDLLVYCEAISPLTRTIGSLIVWAAGGGVGWFLLVWALAPMLQTIAQWLVVWRLGFRVSLGRAAFRRAAQENRRIWPFMLKTNISSSLSLFWMQCGTLAVGAVAGPVEAGGFRIAHRFAKAITKPIETITRALYPELAKLVAQDDHATLRKVLSRVTWVAAACASLVVLITGLAGREILHLIAGRQFEFAYLFFFLLSISTAIDLVGFALEPFHNAHGRAGRVLRTRLVAVVIYGVLLAALLPTIGAVGAALASIAASLALLVQLAVSTAQILRKTGRRRPASELDAEVAATATDASLV